MAEGHDHRSVENEHGFAPRPQRQRKNTRKWCAGKVGRDHVPILAMQPNHPTFRPTECGYYYDWPYYCCHVILCRECGKVLRRDLDTGCPHYREKREPAGPAALDGKEATGETAPPD